MSRRVLSVSPRSSTMGLMGFEGAIGEMTFKFSSYAAAAAESSCSVGTTVRAGKTSVCAACGTDEGRDLERRQTVGGMVKPAPRSARRKNASRRPRGQKNLRLLHVHRRRPPLLALLARPRLRRVGRRVGRVRHSELLQDSNPRLLVVRVLGSQDLRAKNVVSLRAASQPDHLGRRFLAKFESGRRLPSITARRETVFFVRVLLLCFRRPLVGSMDCADRSGRRPRSESKGVELENEFDRLLARPRAGDAACSSSDAPGSSGASDLLGSGAVLGASGGSSSNAAARAGDGSGEPVLSKSTSTVTAPATSTADMSSMNSTNAIGAWILARWSGEVWAAF